MKLLVLSPPFEPDAAPTADVISRIVGELAERGHQVHVVTALPWYANHAIEPGWTGRLVRRQLTPWGSITRIHPFPSDKRSIARRALGFGAFSGLAAVVASVGGRVDAVLSMSPPLTLGLTGWVASRLRRAPLVFNIQDVFPDVAIELGKLPSWAIRPSQWLERFSYHRADAVTVLSVDLRDNLVAKVDPRHRSKIRVIPNFVDTAQIAPQPDDTEYRR